MALLAIQHSVPFCIQQLFEGKITGANKQINSGAREDNWSASGARCEQTYHFTKKNTDRELEVGGAVAISAETVRRDRHFLRSSWQERHTIHIERRKYLIAISQALTQQK